MDVSEVKISLNLYILMIYKIVGFLFVVVLFIDLLEMLKELVFYIMINN